MIFLAALTQKALDTELPSPSSDRAPSPLAIVLEYAADGRIAINKQEVRLADLEARLRDIYSTRSDKTMFVAGDGTLRYRQIVEVIDAARGAGVNRVGIVTDRTRHRDTETRR